MTNKFRIGLIAEIFFLFCLAIVLTIVLTVFTQSQLRISRWFYPNNSESQLIEDYQKNIQKPILAFAQSNLASDTVRSDGNKLLSQMFPFDFKSNLFYFNQLIIAIVDENGNLIHSNTNLTVIPSEIDLEISRTTIPIISFQKKNQFKIIVNNDELIQIKEIIPLNTNHYLMILQSTTFTNFITIFFSILLFCIIFSLLLRGRLNYILFIKKEVDFLHENKFEKEIKLKYNNELTELANTINSMATKIKELNQSEEEFLLSISHDLRTPLTSMLGFLEILKHKKYDNEDEKERYIHIIYEKTLYFKTLLEEFFEFSKIKYLSSDLQKTPVNLQEILRQISDSYSLQFCEKQLTIQLHLPSPPAIIEVDVDKFVRVLENLFSNIIKYSKSGTEVILNLFSEPSKKRIEIWNIPSEPMEKTDLNLIFQRLYKKDSSRNSEGAGLGLSISYEIIKLHNGFIFAELKDEYFGIIIEL